MADLGKQGGSIGANVQAPRVDDNKPAGGDSAPDGDVKAPIYTPPTAANTVKPR